METSKKSTRDVPIFSLGTRIQERVVACLIERWSHLNCLLTHSVHKHSSGLTASREQWGGKVTLSPEHKVCLGLVPVLDFFYITGQNLRQNNLKGEKTWEGAMAQCLRALLVLSEALCSIPSPHMVVHNHL